MKLDLHIDADEMVKEMQAVIQAITKEYLPFMVLGVGIFVLLLILTSFCGSAFAIYCCKKGRFKRVKRIRRKFFQTFKLQRKTRYNNDDDVDKVSL